LYNPYPRSCWKAVANWTATNIIQPAHGPYHPHKRRESRRAFQKPLDLAIIRLHAFLERTGGHRNEGAPNYFTSHLSPLKENHVSQENPLQQLRMSDFS